MYQNIVVGTDGSEQALEAVRRAGEIARLTHAPEIHVVSAVVPYSAYQVGQSVEHLPPEFRDMINPQLVAQDCVEGARTVLAPTGIDVVGHPVTGDPSNAILDVAKSVDADLIVVGARGLGAVARFLRGSVSTRIAHHSPCDVLIVEHGR